MSSADATRWPVPSTDVVGRGPELAAILGCLDRVSAGWCAVVLQGEAGAGKTTVWSSALQAAAARSLCTIACRPAEAEVRLSFAGLGDLLEPILDDVLPSLAPPQRRGLEVALLRRDDEGSPLDERVVCVAVLNLIRTLSAARPTVIAVDDAQWLDAPTGHVLAYVARRLRHEPVALLTTIRATRDEVPFDLDRALPEDRLTRLSLAGLALGPLLHLVRRRTGLSPSRPVLLKIQRLSGGNPLFALEIARALARSDESVDTLAPVAVPLSLSELVGCRVQALPDSTRRALLVAAASTAPTVEISENGVPGALSPAIAEEIVMTSGDRVVFTHPLLAAVAYQGASPEQRRAAHRLLARTTADSEERARHLAVATDVPDEGVAHALSAAARSAHTRGANDAAAELAARAARLTPVELDTPRRARLISAARYALAAGDAAASRAMLDDVLSTAPRGPQRARALKLLGEIHYHDDSFATAIEVLLEALANADDDLELRAGIELDIAYCSGSSGDFPAAEPHARAALEHAESLGAAGPLAEALAVLAMVEFLCGRGVADARMARALELEDRERDVPTPMRPSVIHGLLQLWTGKLAEATATLQNLTAELLERGDESAVPYISLYLTWALLWQGELDAAERAADQGDEVAMLLGAAALRAFPLSARALVHAHRGLVEEARQEAREALAIFQQSDHRAATIWPLSTLGFLELSLGDHAAADRALGPLVDLIVGIGLGEPGTCSFLEDGIEALIALGALDRAEVLVTMLAARGRELDRTWAIAVAARCSAALAAARGDHAGAFAALDAALAQHERMEMHFGRARTMLVAGQVRRRSKAPGARAVLGEALAIFEEIGAPLWADKARRELARIGGRSASHELTATEARVAELAAAGLTNREIAGAAFMSPKTVEANLSRVYDKLGVRSRSALATRIGHTTNPRGTAGQT